MTDCESIQLRKFFGKKAILIATLLIGIFLGDGWSLGRRRGVSYITNYGPEEYLIQPQNWKISQNQQGVIFVANHGGILKYDGKYWESILIPTTTASSIGIDKNGVVFCGGDNEMGFLEPTKNGKLQYVSLVESLDEKKRNFKRVYGCHVGKEGVFFRTPRYVFLLPSGEMGKKKKLKTVYEVNDDKTMALNGSFNCGDEVFINQKKVGLLRFDGETFKLIPGGEKFAGSVVFMVAITESNLQRYLMGSREDGFLIYERGSFIRFPTDVDSYLREKKACQGIVLKYSSGDIAVATLLGGIVIIDRQGRLKYQITKDSGLKDNNAKYLMEDLHGNIWAALDTGVSKCEYCSPFSIYNQRLDLNGIVLCVAEHEGIIYAGTSEGVFRLSPGGEKFTKVSRIVSRCFSIVSVGGVVLAATVTGIYQLENDIVTEITANPSYVLIPSRRDVKRVWAGLSDGLISLSPLSGNKKDQWRVERRFEIKESKSEIRSVAEDDHGNLWVGVRSSGLFRVTFPGDSEGNKFLVTSFNKANQIPDGEIQVFWATGQILFGARSGIFRYDEIKKKFVSDSTLGKKFSNNLEYVFRLVEDEKKNVWFHAKGRNYCAEFKSGGIYDIIKKPFARIPIDQQVDCIYPDTRNHLTWFAATDGLICYNAGFKKDYNRDYYTIIRRVLVNGVPRFYDIVDSGNRQGFPRDYTSFHPVFPYNERNVQFEFTAPFFEGENKIQFRHCLEGFHSSWSNWNSEAVINFIDLESGDYTFRIQALNIYKRVGHEAVFNFTILPPWYMTWRAFALYSIIIALGAFITYKWRVREAEKQKLELTIRERAVEIHRKNQQLETQTALLLEQAEKLKEMDHVKSRFFANISHEFRTPLTLIMGPLEQLLCSQHVGDIQQKLEMMLRNASRLYELINRLLDLSRIDSGKMKLKPETIEITAFLKGIIASFEHKLTEKCINLQFYSGDDETFFFGDPEKMADIFENLLSNAVKFTPPEGRINVSVRRQLDKNDDFPDGSLEISIQDTGIGIPHDQLSHIFDRFYQVDAAKQKHKGSGLGLALTRELVSLHHGKIDVRSRQGEKSGADFILHLPLSQNYLKPDEIAASLEIPDHNQDDPGKIRGVENNGENQPVDFIGDNHQRILGGIPVSPDPCEAGNSRKFEKNTVLIIEDNSDMRCYIRDSIENFYSVTEAEDGESGIRMANAVMPDLIIADIMMPGMDGYQLCRDLKNDFNTSHIPIILLTAKASEYCQIQGLDIGADDYITKPFKTTILLARIKNLIEQRRQLREKFQRHLRLEPSDINISSMDEKFILKLQDVIEKGFSETDFNVEALSEKMDISRVTLNKKIKALTGETANEFIRSFRLKRAKYLLESSFGSVLEVAIEVGFDSQSYFTKCYKEKFGQLPSDVLVKDPQPKQLPLEPRTFSP